MSKWPMRVGYDCLSSSARVKVAIWKSGSVFSMVVLDQSSDSFTALDRSVAWLVGLSVLWKWDDVAKSLRRSLDVVMFVVRGRVAQHRFAEEDHAVGSFLFDGTDETLGEAFSLGELVDSLSASIRIDLKIMSKPDVNFLSRSRIRHRHFRSARITAAREM